MLTGPLQRLKLGTEFLAVVLTLRPQLDNTLPLLKVKGVPGLSHQRWPWNHQKTVYPSAQPLGWRKEVSRGCWLCALEAVAHGLGAQRGPVTSCSGLALEGQQSSPLQRTPPWGTDYVQHRTLPWILCTRVWGPNFQEKNIFRFNFFNSIVLFIYI